MSTNKCLGYEIEFALAIILAENNSLSNAIIIIATRSVNSLAI